MFYNLCLDSANIDEIEAAEEENGSSISSNSPKKGRKDSNSSSDLASPMDSRVTALTMTTAQQVTDHIPSHMLHPQVCLWVFPANFYTNVAAATYLTSIHLHLWWLNYSDHGNKMNSISSFTIYSCTFTANLKTC